MASDYPRYVGYDAAPLYVIASGTSDGSLLTKETLGQWYSCEPDSPFGSCPIGTACVDGACQQTACFDSVDQDGDTYAAYPHEAACVSADGRAEGEPAVQPACSNGVDDDGDGLTDWGLQPGNDPNCHAASDISEVGPCQNGTDDDLDGHPDYPADPDCLAASGLEQFCDVAVIGVAQLWTSIPGTTRNSTDAFTATCGGSGAPDQVWEFTATTSAYYRFRVESPSRGFDPVLTVIHDGCRGESRTCNDDHNGTLAPEVTEYVRAGETVAIIVDGYNGTSGTYVLNVRGGYSAP